MPISLCALIFFLFLPKAEASRPVIDNDRVTVYDVTLAEGKATSAEPRPLDVVRVYLTQATIRTMQPDGKSSVVTRKAGDAVFEPKGTSASEELVSSNSAREAIIELKDHQVEPLPNTSGLPDAFPRQGSKKLLDNDRVTVWDYRWLPGKPTVMHFHGKDVVVIYLEDGVLRSVTPDGTAADNTFSAPAIRFSPRNRTHYEQLMSGSERAIATELK